jgi:hypothetical protein
MLPGDFKTEKRQTMWKQGHIRLYSRERDPIKPGASCDKALKKPVRMRLKDFSFWLNQEDNDE